MNEVVQTWLDAYLKARTTNETDDIRALFTEDATYAGGPFDPEPWIGREGIVDGWISHLNKPGSWAFAVAPLAYSHGIGLIQGQTDYADGGVHANLWVIRFGDGGAVARALLDSVPHRRSHAGQQGHRDCRHGIRKALAGDGYHALRCR